MLYEVITKQNPPGDDAQTTDPCGSAPAEAGENDQGDDVRQSGLDPGEW